MQVTELQYEKEYANRIRLTQKFFTDLDDDSQVADKSELNLEGVAKNLNDELHAVERENSPINSIRGPPLKLH